MAAVSRWFGPKEWLEDEGHVLLFYARSVILNDQAGHAVTPLRSDPGVGAITQGVGEQIVDHP
ncbi:hypothetical protein D3C72_2051700 [compost metagenome]